MRFSQETPNASARELGGVTGGFFGSL